MEYIGEKIIKLQDAKFKTLQNNSNEASIFINGDLAEKLKLVENAKAKFKIEKSDLIKLLCFTFSFKGTIYIKEKITLDLNWFDKYLTLINKHYENSSEFSFDIKKQSQERYYFIGLQQTSGLNIRDLFIQDHIKLHFYNAEVNLLKIECSNNGYIESNPKEITNDLSEIINETNSIRDFALFIFKYFYSTDWNSLLDKCINKTSKINATEFFSYDLENFKRLIAKFDTIQTKDNLSSSGTQRYFDEPIFTENDSFYYFSTQWNGGDEHELSFINLKNYFESNFPNYIILKDAKTYRLLKRVTNIKNSKIFNDFKISLNDAGLIFSDQLIQRFVASLCTKPFVICSGLSGSGKTKLAQAFAQWISADKLQYEIVPVGSDWTNREPLLGYPNALDKLDYVNPENGVLDLLIRARNEYDIYLTDETKIPKPYFLILDEMNLSHVERYFADFLSTMESGDSIPLHKLLPEPTKDLITIPQTLKLPKNLFIIGTVNIDETTYMFSPKVLDRANTIEFRLTTEDLVKYIGSEIKLDMKLLKAQGTNMSDKFMAMALKETDKNLKPSEADLKLFFSELKKSGAEFGYRTASEIGRLMKMLELLGEKGDSLLDIAIMQKLLPKLHGSRSKLNTTLTVLAKFCVVDAITDYESKDEEFRKKYFVPFDKIPQDLLDKIKYKISFEKISRMHKNALENGFTSYAEA